MKAAFLPGLALALAALPFRQPARGAEAPDAPVPEWIWAPAATDGKPPDTAWFQATFRTPPYTWNARLTVAADDDAEVWLNGKPVATCSGADQPVRAEVSVRLIQGDNVLSVRARNRTGPAGLLVHLNLGGTETRQIVSDATWAVTNAAPAGWPETPSAASAAWTRARSLGAHGSNPWGRVLDKATATPAESLQLLPGFAAELLRSAGPDEGSWVCLTFDEKGRLVVSPEGDGKPLLRLSLDGEGRVARVEPVPAPIRFAMGLLFAHGGLYANAKGPSGNGLYRLVDANGNDQFDPDEARLLKEFKGGGEHGYHGLALGPDGRIYVMNGNVTKVPDGVAPTSPYRHYGEDVLSVNPDETTRAGGALAPGGWILRTDPEGRTWESFAGGFRNAYDLDFSPDGELFTFDSDAEWDWGMPWYRPTRVYHVVSGGEAGWRDGTRPWPDGQPDMMGTVLDVGIGSPCGVKFGTRARFPEKYRRALFLQDWSYGRILAVHLEPKGASYRGTFEEFVRGQPLNLTSMAIGPDGALYFVTGGRGTQSGLYRVRYVGGEPASTAVLERQKPASSPEGLAARSRELRRALEAFHGRPDPTATDALWPHLGSEDPVLRQAARIALESQETSRWHNRAIAETNPAVALTALLAMARVGDADDQPEWLEALLRFPLARLSEEQRLLQLRALQLGFLRQGRPVNTVARSVADRLSPRYPASTWAENRELCRILLWLGAPGAVERTLALLDAAPSQEQQVHYIAQLRRVRDGWPAGGRERFFAWWTRPRDHLARPGSLLHWFHDVGRGYVDGANVDRHLESFRRDAIAALPESLLETLRPIYDAPIARAQLIPPTPRPFVKEWTMAELDRGLDEASLGRDFERGRRAFIDTQCYACHRLGNAGAAIGPELGGLASKYRRREILESLVEPSKVISEQYQNIRVFLKDGDDVTGRVVREDADELVVEIDPLTRTEQKVRRRDVESVRPSTVSPMPEGLLNILARDEILDLLAFLESGGNPDAPAFRPRPKP